MNPQDAVSWHRVLMLVEGVGPEEGAGPVAAMMRVTNPYQALGGSGGRSGKGLSALADVLENLAVSDDLSPTEQVIGYEHHSPI